jgi:nitroreductase
VFEAILARRSVRIYTEEIPDSTVVNTLLEAAVRAPTAAHEEPWAFVVIQQRPLLQRLSGLVGTHAADTRLHHPFRGIQLADAAQDDAETDIFHGANTLIVICARNDMPFASADCWLATENLMLAACDLGFGSCVIGSSIPVLNATQVKRELGIPLEYSVIAPVVIGVPAEETSATSRDAPLILTWRQ